MPVAETTVPGVAGPMVPVRHRVVDRRRELADTVTLTLAPEDDPLAPGAAGQFNMLWAFGSGEVPISVSGDPAETDLLVHTVRAVGPSTEALSALRPGDVVGVRGPFGTRWRPDRAAGGDLVVVAGGLGLAPLRPVVLGALAARAAFDHVAVLVGARSPDGLLYLDQVRSWMRRGDLDVHVTVDHAAPGWWGDVGVVTGLLDRTRFDPTRTTALVCGPEIMMRFTAAALVDRGVPPAAVQVSLERNMKCAVAHCGHCQLGPSLVCRDGAVMTYEVAGPLMAVRGR
jgi:NAD(P)H-flavin reductase